MIDFPAVYALHNTLTGTIPASFGGGTATVNLALFEATLRWSYKFDTGSTPAIVAKY